jgi:hypothetical protein
VQVWGDKKEIRRLLVSVGMAGAIWLSSWAPAMVIQMDGMAGRHWIPPVTVGGAIYNYAQMFWIANMDLRLEITCMVVFIAWLIYAVYYAVRNKTGSWIQLMILAFGPWLAEVVASMAWQPILLHRTLIGVTPFLYMLLAGPAARLKRLGFILAGVFLLPSIIVWFYGYFSSVSNSPLYEDNRMLTVIEANWQDGDIVYVMVDNSMVNIWPYTEHSTGSVYKMPDCGPVIGGLTDATREAMGFPIVRIEDLEFERAWIITSETPFDPVCEAEYIGPWISDLEPVKCAGDNYITSCLYLVKP